MSEKESRNSDAFDAYVSVTAPGPTGPKDLSEENWDRESAAGAQRKNFKNLSIVFSHHDLYYLLQFLEARAVASQNFAEVRQAVGEIPENRRKVISTHSAFGYFAARYGIEFIAPIGVSTEAEPSARDVARIIAQMRKGHIPAVFLERIGDPRLMRRISEETGARVGWTLYSDALTGEKGEAPTYIDMVRHNIRTLTGALAN